MNLIAMGICLVVWAANFGIYRGMGRQVASRTGQRPRYPLSWPARAYRQLKWPLYVASLLHIVLQPFWGEPASNGLLRLAAGGALALSGMALLHASLRVLGDNFSPCYEGALPPVRVVKGPYRYCGHPIYLSNVLQLLAAMILLPGPIIAVVFALIVWIYAYAIRDENRSLDQHLGPARGGA